jgi:hypothetical protein
MGTELVYKIARYDVHTDEEVLIEGAQVFSRDGTLWRRVNDGPETVCPETDVAAMIGADAVLGEVRANQVTRITAEGEALRDLPLVLRVPGHGEDFDESLWSVAMQHHLDYWDTAARGMYRVLYVNGARWGAWPTPEGERMLPEGNDEWEPSLTPRVAELSFMESASRTSGTDTTAMGVLTPGAVVFITHFDADSGYYYEVVPSRGGDAAVFVDWLLDSKLARNYFGGDPSGHALLAQLFVDAAMHGLNSETVAGSRLVAGTDAAGSPFGSSDTSDWTLELNIAPAMINAVLDRLAERGPQVADVVMAARDPSSPAGLARRAALEQWEQHHEDWW